MVFKAGVSHHKPAAPVEVAKPPIMKFQQAAKTADKNSRTIVKIQQLLEITQLPGYSKSDPDGHIISRVEFLKKRLNRRLGKLAKWVDTPSEERQAEFRNFRAGAFNIGSATTFNKPFNQPVVGGYGQPIVQSQQQLQLQQQHRFQYQQALQAQSQTQQAPISVPLQSSIAPASSSLSAPIVNNTPFSSTPVTAVSAPSSGAEVTVAGVATPVTASAKPNEQSISEAAKDANDSATTSTATNDIISTTELSVPAAAAESATTEAQ